MKDTKIDKEFVTDENGEKLLKVVVEGDITQEKWYSVLEQLCEENEFDKISYKTSLYTPPYTGRKEWAEYSINAWKHKDINPSKSKILDDIVEEAFAHTDSYDDVLMTSDVLKIARIHGFNEADYKKIDLWRALMKAGYKMDIVWRAIKSKKYSDFFKRTANRV